MKRFRLSVILMVFAMGSIIVTSPSQAQTSPTQITNCRDLQNMINNLNGNYQLVNDIDCSDTRNWNNGRGFIPVGYQDYTQPPYFPPVGIPFSGQFDGQGKTIKNLFINGNIGIGTTNVSMGSYNPNGLFGTVQGSTIQNVNLSNVDIGGPGATGAVLGQTVEGSNVGISNVNVDGKISGGEWTGGLAGIIYEGSIDHASVSITINGTDTAGGLVGTFDGGAITNSSSAGSINNEPVFNGVSGGLVGVANNISIQNSYSTVSIAQELNNISSSIGGLVGYFYSEDPQDALVNSYAAGPIQLTGVPSNNNIYVGGLIGYGAGVIGLDTIKSSYWDAQVTNQQHSAGSLDSYGRSTYEMTEQALSTFIGFDFNNTWVSDYIHYPVLSAEEQPAISLWNTFSAASQQSIFQPPSPPNTVDWDLLSAVTGGVNWSDLLVLSKPPVWGFQSATPTQGLVNSVDWTVLGALTNNSVNWGDVTVLSRTGINWTAVNPLVNSGINWSDWTVSTRSGVNWNDLVLSSRTGINWNTLSINNKAGINWADWAVLTKSAVNWFDVSILSNKGINWNSVGVLSDPVNIHNLVAMSRQGINWNVVNVLSKEGVNWDNAAILNAVPMSSTNLNTLRTIGVSTEGFAQAGEPTVLVTLNLTGNGMGSVSSSPYGIFCTSDVSPSRCTAAFPINQPVTFYFFQANNSIVTNWGVSGCTSGSTSCTFTPDTSLIINIAVNLPPPVVPVILSSSPSGTQPFSFSLPLTVTTNENMTCRYALSPTAPGAPTAGPSYASMTPFATTGGTVHTQYVSGVAALGSYQYYHIKCQDSAGNITPNDDVLSFVVSPPPAPKAPVINVPVSTNGQSLVLTWTENSTGGLPVAYKVLRALHGTNAYTLLATPSALSWTDKTTVAGISYDYKIIAMVTLPTTPTSPDSNIQTAIGSASSVTVHITGTGTVGIVKYLPTQTVATTCTNAGGPNCQANVSPGTKVTLLSLRTGKLFIGWQGVSDWRALTGNNVPCSNQSGCTDNVASNQNVTAQFNQ